MRRVIVASCLALALAACGTTAATTPAAAPTAAMMEAKPTDGAMMEAKPTDGAMMEAKPTDGAMMEAKPTDGAMMEAKPTDGAMMEAKPTDGAMMEAKPTDGAMMEAKPTDGAMMAEPLPAGARVVPLKYIAGVSNAGPQDATGTLTLVPDTNTIIVDVKGLLPVAGKVYEIQLLPAADSGGRFTPASDGSAHFVMKIAKDLKMYNQIVLAIASASGSDAMPASEHSLASEKF